ncbi:MAG: transporter [Verrucomicrobiaceae bacterium]|nr:MAG: transporter [Verrucomicrobiaceae bacterium]
MISFPLRSSVPTVGRFLSGAITGFLLAGSVCHSQEIEPRRWSHIPLGSDFIGGAYAYTTGDITFDPLLRIEEGEFELHTAAVKYIHSFDLIGKSARIDLAQAYQSGEWSGLLNGIPATVEREGWSDTLLRFAVNLYGAPPLAGKEYAEYRARTKAETIVGAGIGVQLPTGHYLEDKLINLGSNRFTFRPQLGFVHNRGPWSIELNAAAWLYTHNNKFFQGRHLEQDPFYTVDGHLIYTLRPGLWMGAGAGYGYGGETTVNAVSSHNQQRNFAWGLSLGIPLHRQLGLKFAWINTRTLTSTGADTNTFTGGFSLMW